MEDFGSEYFLGRSIDALSDSTSDHGDSVSLSEAFAVCQRGVVNRAVMGQPLGGFYIGPPSGKKFWQSCRRAHDFVNAQIELSMKRIAGGQHESGEKSSKTWLDSMCEQTSDKSFLYGLAVVM